MASLKDRTVQYLNGKTPQSANLIAKALGAKKTEINQLLYHDLTFRRFEGPGSAPGWGLMTAALPVEGAIGSEFVPKQHALDTSKGGSVSVALMAGGETIEQFLTHLDHVHGAKYAYLNEGAMPGVIENLNASHIRSLWKVLDEGESEFIEALCVLTPPSGTMAGFCQLSLSTELEVAMCWATKKGVPVVAVTI